MAFNRDENLKSRLLILGGFIIFASIMILKSQIESQGLQYFIGGGAIVFLLFIIIYALNLRPRK
ncbi:MAG: hypothetical protein D6B28_12050 [Gammaproteobacteria bacterium]|nr:MAG: hypothetical protein D6B28_12050 [Gammaproteobacteria bacterium]